MKHILIPVLLVTLILTLFKACNPVVDAGEASERTDATTLGIYQELKVLADSAHEIVSNFMVLSPEEQRNWVQRAESLLGGTMSNRTSGVADFRELPDLFVEGFNTYELMPKREAFDELFSHIMPTSATEKLVEAAQSILEKRPELINMDEEELMDVLTAEIDAIYRHHTIGGKKSENPHLILSECEGLCVAEAMAYVTASLIRYVSSMVKCGATGPGYGLCAGLATAYKTASLLAVGMKLYNCVNKC